LKLNSEEQYILNSVESGEWQSVADLQQEIERYTSYFQSSEDVTEDITVYLKARDLKRLQEKADSLGVSVQTLASQALHKYATSDS
jgi:predicted DNA binding CopG/RHH family protein